MDSKSQSRGAWCVAYINSDFLAEADKTIERSAFPDLWFIIPTVRLLVKNFKGHPEFTQVPLLFNYGFFKLPFSTIHSKEELETIRKSVPLIFSWLYKTELSSKELDEDGEETGKYLPTPQVETVKFKEIIRLRNIGLVESVYSSTDLDNVKPGSFIILKGYPFDGLPAEVIEIKKRSQKLKIKLLLDTFSNNITVDFANVFYTVYREFNAPITYDDRSIESLLERSKFSIDKLTFENERPTE